MSFPSLLRAVPLMTVTERVPFPQAPEAGVFVGLVENRGSGCRWQRLCQGHTVRLRDPHVPRIHASCQSSLRVTAGKRLARLACERG